MALAGAALLWTRNRDIVKGQYVIKDSGKMQEIWYKGGIKVKNALWRHWKGLSKSFNILWRLTQAVIDLKMRSGLGMSYRTLDLNSLPTIFFSTDLGYHHMCIKLSVQCNLELYKLKPEFGWHITTPSLESACPY